MLVIAYKTVLLLLMHITCLLRACDVMSQLYSV